MTEPDTVRRLADDLVEVLLAADPFVGSGLGRREYDPLLPDPSREAEDALDATLGDLDARAAAVVPADAAQEVTLAAVRATCARERRRLAVRAPEWTVTPMPYSGPAVLVADAARTVLPDARAAEDFLSRLRAAPAWVDGLAERLRAGREQGRLPVASLVDQAVAWVDKLLAEPVPAAFLAPVPPDGVDAAAFRDDVSAAVTDGIAPALQRWRALLVQLAPDARPDDRAGVTHLPGGDELYARCVAVHTTLPPAAGGDPTALHELGLREVARLEQRALEIGGPLGLRDLPAVHAAVRASSTARPVDEALAAAREAVRRAEAEVHRMMPPPLPAPCAVEPMPGPVGESGAAPHYTRPRADGGRPGTFWFNTQRATAGSGWDLEAVAFHETVPGHHSQIARLALLPDLPVLQQLTVTVHAEGWGLYAERLAGEFGLYSDAHAELGSVFIELHRAARLVVDTGLHDRGWSRGRAADYLLDHVALPETFLRDEIDRYIAWPGQALAYQTGLHHILGLRRRAEDALGARFDLPGFHAALLDSGSVALPVLDRAVDAWVASVG